MIENYSLRSHGACLERGCAAYLRAALVPELEKTDKVGAASRLVFDKRHDEVFGPGYATGVGVQWQNGKKVAIWPNNWNGVTYEGVKPFKMPPQMLAQKKSSKGS